MSLSVHASVFPTPGTRAEVGQVFDGLPYLSIGGDSLRLSLHTIDAADPEFLAFAESLRDAAAQLVRDYRATFPAAPGDETASAA